MNKIKKFYPFGIGFLMGLIGQTIIPAIFKPVKFTAWDLTGLISNGDIYPLVIVFMICRKNQKPKTVFTTIFTYFIGLCVGYYLWTTSLSLYQAIKTNHKDMFFSNFLADFSDGFGYSVLGFFAALWGAFMIRLKNCSKKLPYYLMFVPFMLFEIYMMAFHQFFFSLYTLVDFICLIMVIFYMHKTGKEFSSQKIQTSEQ